MKICNRFLNYMQIIDADGTVRTCSWRRNNIIGSILCDDLETIYNSEAFCHARDELLAGDYSGCDIDNCPYLSNNRLDDILVDYHDLPKQPTELALAYEGMCNYNCTVCTSHEHMETTRIAQRDWIHQYDMIKSKLQDILPHVTTLSAHGRGELFASRHIMSILSDWQPSASPDQISVILETNGSLFNQKNWEKISNLGQYNLTVEITVMSFNEADYQYLSGTRLPINVIEDSLRFVKSLRDKGIINRLELATVLQEYNFREMPSFVTRCIDEFGADIVRVRPFFPGGIYDENVRWFFDVRNPYHPYFNQYKQVMKHPVFQHPKVLLWSNDYDSTLGMHPGTRYKKLYLSTIGRIVNSPESIISELSAYLSDTGGIAIYGAGIVGKSVIQAVHTQIHIEYVFDRNADCQTEYLNIPICLPEMIPSLQDRFSHILITVYGRIDEIATSLRDMGYRGHIINLFELLDRLIC